jgi:transcriptional regulator with XRE-family HTH domain
VTVTTPIPAKPFRTHAQAARWRAHLTLDDVSAATDITASDLSRFERRVRTPTAAQAARLGKALCVPVDLLTVKP